MTEQIGPGFANPPTFEIGKKYTCRNRPDIKWVRIDGKSEEGDALFCTYLSSSGNYYVTYLHLNGRIFTDADTNTDLVAPYVEPVSREVTVYLWQDHTAGEEIYATVGAIGQNENYVSCLAKKTVTITEGEGME